MIMKPADDAHVVCGGKLLSRGVRIKGVHIVDGPSWQHHVVERLLERPHRKIHRPDGEQGQGVDPDHDDEEEDVEEHPDQSDCQLGVEDEHCLILPGVLAMKVDGVEDVLNQGVHDDGEEDGVLKAKHQLHARSLGQRGGVGVLDEKCVHWGKHQGKGENSGEIWKSTFFLERARKSTWDEKWDQSQDFSPCSQLFPPPASGRIWGRVEEWTEPQISVKNHPYEDNIISLF